MPSDKKSSKEKTKKLPKEALLLSEKPLKEQIGYFSVLLENIEGQVRAIAENQQQLEYRLNTKMESVRDELKQDIELTQMAVRSHSTQLQSQSAQIQQLDKKVENLDRKADVLQKDMTEVKERLDRVENKLDRVVEKVEVHDKDIVILKAEVFPG